MNNIDCFNGFVAAILAQLYDGFPVKCMLDARTISGHGDVDDFGGIVDHQGRPSRPFEIAMGTIEWLIDNGYVRAGERHIYGYRNAVLSERGLELLKRGAGNLASKESWGDKLLRLVREGSIDLAREAAKALISAGVESAA